ncbi:MAG: hypothetical protein SYC29_16965 [Planctomycetota bacterium]|nr:hypothetical protein [Planctomycetota bacterium]
MKTFRPFLRVTLLPSLVFSAVVLIAGCGGGETDDGGDASTAGTNAAAHSSTPASEATLPDGLFLASAPTDATSLSEAKSAAAVGDEVSFKARIGGRVEPFTEQVATFLVADRSMPTCLDRHGDGCPTPWDYCCEPRESLLANLATVQLVDETGRPLRMSLNGTRGLAPMKDIIVVGTVSQADGPAFVIDARGIYLEQG